MEFLRCVLTLLCLTASAWSADDANKPGPTAGDYLRVIRAGDLASLTALCKMGTVGVRDHLDWTPLHYAALYGTAEAVRIVLEAGGDPNARNRSQITPVVYGAYSFEKTRLLVEKGGDVNAKSSDGYTALLVASSVPGNGRTVRYLVEKGADAKAQRPSGGDYLMRAAGHQDVETVRFLLDQGLDPRHATDVGATALAASVMCDGGAKTRLLMAAGSDVNAFDTDEGKVKNGPIESTRETPLMFAAACGDSALVGDLIKSGANVNALDGRHMTALMRAVAIDGANPEAARLLIAAGADVNIPDRNGEAALDWARKYRNPSVVALLEKNGGKGKGLAAAPAKPTEYKPQAREAIERASSLLVKSNDVFFREGGGCIGCHHQPFAGRVFAAVKEAGLSADPRLRQILLDGMIAERPVVLTRVPVMLAGGGGYDSFLYPLEGMADMGEPATRETDAMIHYIAESQDVSGAWSSPGSRPPLQESTITQTTLAMYALKTYGWPARRAEFKERIGRGKAWLLNAKAATTVEEADRLTGLWLAGADKTDLKKASQSLLKQQHSDGGWAQTAYLDSDAFGTAAALFSLRKTGFSSVTDAVYQKGARFLLNTQFPDGSWYVRSRVVKLQPYFQSAFPYDHDQWISNSATAYAVMALAPIAAASR